VHTRRLLLDLGRLGLGLVGVGGSGRTRSRAVQQELRQQDGVQSGSDTERREHCVIVSQVGTRAREIAGQGDDAVAA